MNKTIIKVVSSEWDHEFIGTKSEAKKFYLKIALEIMFFHYKMRDLKAYINKRL